MPRILISVRRRVENEREAAYDAAWLAFRNSAVALGAKAWRFRSAQEQDLRLEFLEFKVEADPRQDAAVVQAVALLDELAPGRSEAWNDANLP